MRLIITLLTDFGLSDPFVGIMKGVILGINPEAHLIDLCHGIPSYDLIQAGFLLKTAYPYFPKGSIHVVVVDPGVGGPRRPIAAFIDGHFFVGPDNGVFSYLYAPGKVSRVVEITASHYFLHPVSATFHGRDIFAPVAAYLSKGIELRHFGRFISDYVHLEVPMPKVQGDTLHGEVLVVDKFGNLITNIAAPDLEPFLRKGGLRVRIGDREIQGLSAFYAEVEEGELGALVGSTGCLEVFVHRGSAAELLKVERGTEVVILVR
ncbi:MAG: S-adenosyl-l-methionine hydroxide adenosyltransferase family protein [Candidatus Methylomirabilales bacterium]